MMPELKSIIETDYSFEQMEPIIRNAKEEISFWGHRYFYIDGYSGQLPIGNLARKVSKMFRDKDEEVKRNNKLGKIFEGEEEKAARALEGKVNQLYADNDARTSTKNLLTFIFCKIRDLLYHFENQGYNERCRWELGDGDRIL